MADHQRFTLTTDIHESQPTQLHGLVLMSGIQTCQVAFSANNKVLLLLFSRHLLLRLSVFNPEATILSKQSYLD